MPGRGKEPSWADDDRRIRAALDLARRPLNGSQTGGYGIAVLTLERTLDTVERLEGDELRCFAERYGTSKPEIAEAIASLREKQSQAG